MYKILVLLGIFLSLSLQSWAESKKFCLTGSLPKDYQGSLLVVLHVPPWAHSELAHILSRSGPLRAIQAGPHEPLEPGCMESGYGPVASGHPSARTILASME